MTRRHRWVLVVLVLYAMLGHRYSRVWHSDLTLWAYARTQTPFYPLPLMNYAKAVAGTGRLGDVAPIVARVEALERARR